MAGYSNFVISGNVGADPEFRYTQSGRAVMSFPVALDQGFFNKTTEVWIDKVQWWKVTLWGDVAERLNGSGRIYKGRFVICEGSISASGYQSGEEIKTSMEMTVHRGGAIQTPGKSREQESSPAGDSADDLVQDMMEQDGQQRQVHLSEAPEWGRD